MSSTQRKRLLVAWLPAFRLERCGWSAREPVALVNRINGTLIVLSTTPSAAKRGVVKGMSATEARALIPTLHLEHRESPKPELVDLESLSRCFEILGPTYRTLGNESIAVELCEGVLGGENACVEAAVDTLRQMGHISVVTVVDGDRCDAESAALGLAIWRNRHAVIPPKRLSNALSEIPLEILAPLLMQNSTLANRLNTMGVTTASDFSKLQAAAIARRFGDEGLRLLKMVRADRTSQPPPPNRPPDLPSLYRELDSRVTTTTALMPHIKELVNCLAARLVANEQAATQIQLNFKLESTPDSVMTIRTVRPWRRASTILSLISQRLEQWSLNEVITALELKVIRKVRWYGSQPSLLHYNVTQKEPLEELVIRLEDTLGESKMFRPRRTSSHRPEAAWKDIGPAESGLTNDLVRRPSVILPRPETIGVEFKFGPRHVELDGRWLEVRGRMGPERISGEWWSEEHYSRDYWQLELNDGRRPWIFHDRRQNEWRLHGWFE